MARVFHRFMKKALYGMDAPKPIFPPIEIPGMAPDFPTISSIQLPSVVP
jgi:hypothetical protein